MGFILGWVVGFALGFGLIVGFARFQTTRSKRRCDLLNWLNQLLDKIWPYVDEAASEIIRNSVEPILEQYRPAILASLKFSTLTLGTVAPHFTGITVLESQPKELVMEMELQWDGILILYLILRLELEWHYPSRLIFKPLVDEIPCFGAVCYSLREKRNLDFTLKVIGGDISAVPGVSTALEDTIRDAIEDSITWPVRKIVPIIPGDYSYLEVKPVGVLEVKLIEAKELTNKDVIGKSDPFAQIFVRPLRAKTKTSKVIDNDINPIWNEHFAFEVEDELTQHLTLQPVKIKDVWLKLVKDLHVQRDRKNRGQVHVELLYCPLSTDSIFSSTFDPDFRLTSLEKALKQVTEDVGDSTSTTTPPAKPPSYTKKDILYFRGVLSVTIMSAENLPATDLMGKSDPFVVLTMRKSEHKCKTRTFDFVVEDGLHELLIMEVYDHDTFGKDKMGRCLLTLTRCILEGEFTESLHIEGTKSGKLNMHLKWTSQTIIKD
ncbi:UNVERIFIED_CONTAM: Synaptotagmin-4 [Sesamum angustifolium]|uniref:Synaptotagmin-4 n=1 Tax=Sesamum angustifolium TaxID=2727405 RepID=A0AAW2MHG6_9LAMI